MKQFFVSALGCLNTCVVCIVAAFVCVAFTLFLPKNRF